MTTSHKPLRNQEARTRFARIIRHRLTLLIGFLSTLLLVLLFRVGELWWPAWIIAHQKQAIGLLVLAILCLFLLAPVIVEADSDPRPLDGPGKNPYL